MNRRPQETHSSTEGRQHVDGPTVENSHRHARSPEANHPPVYTTVERDTDDSPSTARIVATRYRPTLIARLTARGFTQADAEEWTSMRGNLFWTRRDLVDVALAYSTAGFDAPRGREWARLRLTPDDARNYEAAGWTPDDLTAARRAISDTYDYPDSPHIANGTRPESEDWFHTGLPAHLVPLYIRVGYTPETAQAVHARHRSGGRDIAATLTVLAALKGTHPVPVPVQPPAGPPNRPRDGSGDQ